MEEKIRLMQEDDLIRCAELLEDAYSKEPYNEEFIPGSALKYIKNKFEAGKDNSFVFLLDNNIVGFIISSLSYWSVGPQAIMEEIVFDEKVRGKGYAKKITEYLEKHLKEKGVTSGMLWVKRDSAAHKFHLKNNYQEANDLVIMFKDF